MTRTSLQRGQSPRSAIKFHDQLLAAASEQGESTAEEGGDQCQESFHGLEILHDMLIQEQSDPALKPAVSFTIRRRAEEEKGHRIRED